MEGGIRVCEKVVVEINGEKTAQCCGAKMEGKIPN